MTQFESIPIPSEVKKELPLSIRQKEFITQSRHQIKRILENRDPRLLLIVGPCSIHDITAAKDYAIKLKQLSKEVESRFFIVMRSYFEKPRTTFGWKGLLYDPHLNGSNDIIAGLRLSRQFLLELADLEIPAATEFLDPITPHYFGDLISWGSIGARTTASQIHRQLVSGLHMPVGFKNTTDGDLTVAVNALASASTGHTFIGVGDQGQAGIVRTLGNPDVHVVLRGNEKQPNYDPASIELALQLLEQANLPLRVLVDCSHDNSYKKHENQPSVFKSVLNQYLEGNSNIRGLMLESHLQAGSQPLSPALNELKYAISLTDPCIDWKTTEELIHWGYDRIHKFGPDLHKHLQENIKRKGAKTQSLEKITG